MILLHAARAKRSRALLAGCDARVRWQGAQTGTAEQRARRQGRGAGCGRRGMHIMSAGSLPAMYGGVSIAISYAKHPAHRHHPHAWHGHAKQNEAVAGAVRPSTRGVRSVALDETPHCPASIRDDELPSLRITRVAQAVRCAS
jgi:hypothetical protein